MGYDNEGNEPLLPAVGKSQCNRAISAVVQRVGQSRAVRSHAAHQHGVLGVQLPTALVRRPVDGHRKVALGHDQQSDDPHGRASRKEGFNCLTGLRIQDRWYMSFQLATAIWSTEGPNKHKLRCLVGLSLEYHPQSVLPSHGAPDTFFLANRQTHEFLRVIPVLTGSPQIPNFSSDAQ